MFQADKYTRPWYKKDLSSAQEKLCKTTCLTQLDSVMMVVFRHKCLHSTWTVNYILISSSPSKLDPELTTGPRLMSYRQMIKHSCHFSPRYLAMHDKYECNQPGQGVTSSIPHQVAAQKLSGEVQASAAPLCQQDCLTKVFGVLWDLGGHSDSCVRKQPMISAQICWWSVKCSQDTLRTQVISSVIKPNRWGCRDPWHPQRMSVTCWETSWMSKMIPLT